MSRFLKFSSPHQLLKKGKSTLLGWFSSTHFQKIPFCGNFHVPKFRRIKAKSALFCWKTGHFSTPPFMRFFQTAFLQSNPTWSLPQSSLHDTTSLFQDYFNLFWISHFQKFYWCCVFQNCLFALFLVQLDKVQKNFVLSSRASIFEDLDICFHLHICLLSVPTSIFCIAPS